MIEYSAEEGLTLPRLPTSRIIIYMIPIIVKGRP
jgi:hypothetical protein